MRSEILRLIDRSSRYRSASEFDDFSITKFLKFKLRIYSEYVDYTRIEINEMKQSSSAKC